MQTQGPQLWRSEGVPALLGQGRHEQGGGHGSLLLAPHDLMAVKGVVVEEIVEDVDKEAAANLKYSMLDVREYDVGKHLSFAALHMVGANLLAAEGHHSLSIEKQERYDMFAEAYISNYETGALG